MEGPRKQRAHHSPWVELVRLMDARADLSWRLKARNLLSGLSQLSSCHVTSSGFKNSGRPRRGCPLLNLSRPLQDKQAH